MKMFWKLMTAMNQVAALMGAWPQVKDKIKEFAGSDPQVAMFYEIVENLVKKLR